MNFQPVEAYGATQNASNEPLAFTTDELNGATFYASFLNDETASCGLNTWITESITYDGTNYTLTFCDGSTEVGTYEVISGDVRWNVPTGGTDFTRRLSYDSQINGWLVCITETQPELDSCTSLDQSYLFDNLTDAEAFQAQQNLTPEIPLSGAYAFTDVTDQPGMLVFYPNNFYLHWQSCADEGVGVEYGIYQYDGTIFTSTPSIDENGSCGLSEWQSFPVSVQTNQLTFEENGSTYILPRNDGGADSIVGAWSVGGSSTTPWHLYFMPTENT